MLQSKIHSRTYPILEKRFYPESTGRMVFQRSRIMISHRFFLPKKQKVWRETAEEEAPEAEEGAGEEEEQAEPPQEESGRGSFL